MKRGLIVVVVTVVLVSALGFASGQKESAASAAEPTKVVFWFYISAGQFEWTRDVIIPMFEEKHPNIEVEVIHIPSRGEADQKIITAIASNTQVDIIRINPDFNLTQYAKLGYVVPLDNLAKQGKLAFSEFYKGAIDLLTVDGKVFGLPYTALPRPGLWYNKEYFDAAGLSYPNDNWKLEDFRSAAKRLRKDDTFGATTPADNIDFEIVMHSFGGAFTNTEGTRSMAANPESVEAMQFLYDMVYKDNSIPKQDQMEGNFATMFGAGRIGMKIGNYWERGPLTKAFGDKYTLKSAPLPLGPKGRFIQFVTGSLAITRTSKNPTAAFEYLKFYTGDEINTLYVEKGFNPASRPAVNNKPQFKDDAILQEWLRYYEIPYRLSDWPKNLRKQQLNETQSNAIQRMFTLGEAPAQVMKDLDKEINELLALPAE
jgi:multiple sugar transport system substrate-binding protein